MLVVLLCCTEGQVDLFGWMKYKILAKREERLSVEVKIPLGQAHEWGQLPGHFYCFYRTAFTAVGVVIQFAVMIDGTGQSWKGQKGKDRDWQATERTSRERERGDKGLARSANLRDYLFSCEGGKKKERSKKEYGITPVGAIKKVFLPSFRASLDLSPFFLSVVLFWGRQGALTDDVPAGGLK